MTQPLLVEKDVRPGGVQLTFKAYGLFESYWVTRHGAVATDYSEVGLFPTATQQEVNRTLVETIAALNEKGAQPHGESPLP